MIDRVVIVAKQLRTAKLRANDDKVFGQFAVETIPVLTFLAVISTPGINAPLVSETVPPTTAFTWPNALMGTARYSTMIAPHVMAKPFMMFSYHSSQPSLLCRAEE